MFRHYKLQFSRASVIFSLIGLVLVLISIVSAQTCDPGCQREINNLNNVLVNLETQMESATANINSLLNRMFDLENDYYSTKDTLNTKLSKLETYLARNVSDLRDLIRTESQIIYDSLSSDLSITRSDLNSKISNLTIEVNILKANAQYPGTPGPTPSYPLIELYNNITQRINTLEYGKVQNLSVDNSIWRKNFRVVNSTFERMKRNNCLC